MHALLPLIAAAPVMLAVGYSDMRHLSIPNGLSYLVIGIFLASLVIAPPNDWALRLEIAAGVLSVGAIAFFSGIIGAGDVKILSAILLLVPSSGIAVFAYVLAACLAVVLGILLPARRVVPAGGTRWAGMAQGPQFPMGLAIALAALVHPWVSLYLV